MNAHVIPASEAGAEDRPRVGVLSPFNCQPSLPAHDLYVETRGSDGAWLFCKPRSKLEVLNDRDGEAMNLSRLLSHERERSELAAIYADPQLDDLEMGSPIHRAVRFADSIERATRRVGRMQMTLRTAPPMASGLRRLDRAMDRLRGVQMESGSTEDLFERYDWGRAFFLCDERGHNWNREDVEPLIRSLDAAKGRVMLLIDGRADWLGRRSRWQKLPIGAPRQGIASVAEGDLKESVWVNY
jgi:hypothetical protein